MPFAAFALVALTSLPPGGAPVAPDGDVYATRYDADVVFEGSLATLDVTLELENRGLSDVPEVSLDLDLPEGGVARDFALREGGSWQVAELLPEDVADERFGELFEAGTAPRRAVGLLSHSEGGSVQLRVYPLMPRARVQVRYQVQAPLHFQGGRWLLDTQREDTSRSGEWLSMRLVPRQLDVAVSADGRQAWRAEGVSSGEVQGVVASALLAPGDWATRIHFGAAAPLSQAPRGASVVFVLDASHSEGDFGIAGQLRVLRRYLSFVPDARVEIVVFRRRAGRLFGGFVPAAELEAQLATRRIAPGNGSALEAGLAAAAEALKGRTGPLRVVVLTDGWLREGFGLPLARRVWPRGTVLHVALVQVNWAQREPLWDLYGESKREHPLAPLAEETGGVVLALSLPSIEEPDLEERDPVEELVRPVRIEDPRVLAEDAAVAEDEMPRSLDEGESFTHWLRAPDAPGPLQMEGRLWSRTARWPLERDARLSRALPALVVNAPEEAPVEETERAAAARASGVVGPGQSALAAFPGAGPMGLLQDGLGGFGSGRDSIDIGCRGRLRPGPVTPDASAWLARLLAPAARRCGAGAVTLQVETTYREVVNVRATSPASPQASCLIEAAWALRLDERFTQAHGVFDVQAR